MKINKNDLMSDELWRYTMVDGQKRYVQAKKRMLDINQDSKVGQAEYNGNANIGMDYISPASNEELTAPKELPWNGMNVTKSNAYNNYNAKIPTSKKGGGYVATIPDIKTKEIIIQEQKKEIPKNDFKLDYNPVITSDVESALGSSFKKDLNVPIIKNWTLSWKDNNPFSDMNRYRAQNAATSTAWNIAIWINNRTKEYQDALNYVNSMKWIKIVNQEDLNKYNKALSIIKNYK